MKYLKKYNEVIKIDFAGKDDWLLAPMKEVESYFQYVDDDGYSVQIDKPGSSSTPMGLISKCSELGRDVNNPPYIEVTIAKELYAERAFKHEPDANMFELTDELIKSIGFAVKGLEKEGIKLYMTMIQHRTYREHQEMLHVKDSTVSVNDMLSFLKRGYDNNVMGYEGRVGYIRLYFYVEPHVAEGSIKQPRIYESSFSTGTELTNIINLNLEDNKEFEIINIKFNMNQDFNASGTYPIIGTGSGYKTIRITIHESFENNEEINNMVSKDWSLDTAQDLWRDIHSKVIEINKITFNRLGKKYDFKIDTISAVHTSRNKECIEYLVEFNIYY